MIRDADEIKVATSDGRTLVAAARTLQAFGAAAGPKLLRSTDRGTTWTAVLDLPRPAARGVALPDGTVILSLGGEQGAKDNGKMRQEGKEYVVNDGDIFHFRFNV